MFPPLTFQTTVHFLAWIGSGDVELWDVELARSCEPWAVIKAKSRRSVARSCPSSAAATVASGITMCEWHATR